MSEFQLNSFVRSLFDGFGDGRKDKRLQNQFDELEWTPFLFSSDYLNNMYDKATNKAQHESILEHIYKHSSVIEEYGVKTYKKIEQRIINDWR